MMTTTTTMMMVNITCHAVPFLGDTAGLTDRDDVEPLQHGHHPHHHHHHHHNHHYHHHDDDQPINEATNSADNKGCNESGEETRYQSGCHLVVLKLWILKK